MRCELCATPNPAANSYCGGCGTLLVAAIDAPSEPAGRGGRRPLRMLIAGGVLFIVSAIVAGAAFAAIQATGSSSMWMDLGGPAINRVLESTGITGIRAPEPQDDGASKVIVATFLLAFVLAGVSLLIMAWGAVRMLIVNAGTARRHAAAGLQRGSEEYAKVSPHIARAAKKGRETFDADVKPRLSAGAARANEQGRAWIAKRRSDRDGGGGAV